MMQWDRSMEVGIGTIDQQHQELVGKVNELVEAMKSGKGRQVIGDVLVFLGEYAVKHFANEEALMQRHGYHEATAHKQLHEAFKADFGALAKDFDANPGKLSLTIDVQRRVTDWLKHHILNVDAKLGAFLQTKGVG